MSAADRIGHVLVAGGGLTAWYAAAALKRRAPFLTVTLLATLRQRMRWPTASPAPCPRCPVSRPIWASARMTE
ncbi:hypothetical protein P0F65_12740 [Sphingomonas sp. I4]